jgi:threonine dehydrogenase-like Zn-dependent dehydrogenase
MFIMCSFGLQIVFIITSFSTQTSGHASLQGEQQGDVIVLVVGHGNL